MWTFTAGSTGVPSGQFTQPYAGTAVADLQGNGSREVVAAFPDGNLYVLDAATGHQLWHYRTGGGIYSAPTIADIDGDGLKEILVTSQDGYVYAFNFNGSMKAGWPQRAFYGPQFGFPKAWFGGVAVGDLFGNGQNEIVGESWDHFLYAWNANGQLLPGFPDNLWDTSWTTPALADLQHNGKLDIVVGSDSGGPPTEPLPKGGGVWAFLPSGCSSPNADESPLGTCQVPGFPKATEDTVWSRPAVADLADTTNNSYDVISGAGFYWANVAGFNTHHIYGFTQSGGNAWSSQYSTSGWVFGSPAIGTLDSTHGAHQVVDVDKNGNLYAINHDGSTLFTAAVGAAAQLSSPSIGPVDATGSNGVWLSAGAQLYGYNKSGTLVVNDNSVQGYAAPTIADLGGAYAGKLSVVVSGGAAGSNFGTWEVQAFPIPGSPTSMPAGAWPTEHGNMQRSGSLAPTAHVTSATVGSTSAVSVAWTTDTGSTPASSYSIYVKTDSGSWIQWIESTTATSATFYGQPGHSYSFIAVAESRAGEGDEVWAAQQPAVSTSGKTAAEPWTLYSANAYGRVGAENSPPLTAGALWPGWKIGRGISVNSAGNGGVILDGWGGLHAFGTQPGISSGGAYWPGWDIARGVVLNPCDGGHTGYTLDGWGGIHPVGGAPWVSQTAYWRGWDIARGITIYCSGGTPRGYVLDGWGGVHPFGGAPYVHVTGYWPNWDIARGITVNSSGTGGYVLDGWGGIHPFGSAGYTSITAYWKGWDIARGITLVPGSSSQGWVVDGWGGFHPFGGAPSVTNYTYHAGDDATRGVSAG